MPTTHFHTTFGATLRQLADTEPDAERARQMALLASQLEVAFDQQGSNVQVALWDVQDATRTKIDDLHAHQADTNTLLSGVMEALNGLRGDVQASAAESAARLGKLENGQAAIAGQVNDLSERVDTIDGRDQQQYAESKAHRERIQQAIDTIRAEQYPVELRERALATIAAHEAELEAIRADIAALKQARDDAER
jgi:hypothetical protein